MKIQILLENEIKNTRSLIEAFPWNEARAYAWWLSQTFHFVKYTTRLASLAAGWSTLEEEELHQQFLYHIREEGGHEALLLNDLKSLGADLQKEEKATHNFYQMEFASILEKGAKSHLGYSLFLEYLAITLGEVVYRQVSQNFGAESCRFLEVHVKEDKKHVAETLAAVEKQISAEELEEFIVFAAKNYRALVEAYRPFDHRLKKAA